MGNISANIQDQILVLTPVFTGSLSFLSSSALLCSILFVSKLKLKSPKRRILFGFCCFNVILTLALISSSFAAPQGKVSVKAVLEAETGKFYLNRASCGQHTCLSYNKNLSNSFIFNRLSIIRNRNSDIM